MKKFFAILVALFLFVHAACLMAQPLEDPQTFTAGTGNTPVTLAFPTTGLLIVNDGTTNSVFVTVASSVATTSDHEVKPGESLALNLAVRTTSIGLVTSAGTTAVRVYALEGQVSMSNLAGGGGGAGGATEATLLTRASEATLLLVETDTTTLAAATHLEDVPHVSGDRGMAIWAVRNEAIGALAFADGDYIPIGTTRSGQVLGVPYHNSSATSALQISKLEDAVHGSGDAGVPMWGVANTSFSTRASNNDYVPISTALDGIQYTYPRHDLTVPTPNQISKKEDAAHASEDAGIMDLGVMNTGFVTLVGAQGDYVPKAHTNQGLYLTSLVLDTTLGDARVPVKNEDTVSGGGMAGIATLGIRNEAFVTLAGTNLDYIQFATDKEGRTFVRSMDAVLLEELIELIGIDENVANTEYGASVSVALAATHSGEILKACLTATEDGSGSILTPAGTLFILDAATANAVGAAAITAVERLTVLARITYAAADWQSDVNGGTNCKVIADGFHANGTLHALWFHEDATAFNDVAGDDEQLEVAFWYRRDS